jgi:hypothetical protein
MRVLINEMGLQTSWGRLYKYSHGRPIAYHFVLSASLPEYMTSSSDVILTCNDL